MQFNGVKQITELLSNPRSLKGETNRKKINNKVSFRLFLSKEEREKLNLNLTEAKLLNEGGTEENKFFFSKRG